MKNVQPAKNVGLFYILISRKEGKREGEEEVGREGREDLGGTGKARRRLIIRSMKSISVRNFTMLLSSLRAQEHLPPLPLQLLLSCIRFSLALSSLSALLSSSGLRIEST
jgi:hypothetical protein